MAVAGCLSRPCRQSASEGIGGAATHPTDLPNCDPTMTEVAREMPDAIAARLDQAVKTLGRAVKELQRLATAAETLAAVATAVVAIEKSKCGGPPIASLRTHIVEAYDLPDTQAWLCAERRSARGN